MRNVLYPYVGASQADAYEQLNLCAGPEQKIEACMEQVPGLELAHGSVVFHYRRP